MIFQDQLPCVEIGLRPNPNVIANFRDPVKAPLNICLSTDKNAVPNFEGLQMFEAHTAIDPHPMTKFSRNRSPDGPAHQVVQLAIAICES